MKLSLTYYGNPVLRQKAKPVEKIDDFIIQLVEDMHETMIKERGAGLAAPQVNHSLALFVTIMEKYDQITDTWTQGEFRVFINPKILNVSQENWTCSEACLSIPNMRADVDRPFRVTIEATDLDGNRFVEDFEEHDAHVILHENDHINGVLYIDRISKRKRKEMEPYLQAIKKKYQSK